MATGSVLSRAGTTTWAIVETARPGNVVMAATGALIGALVATGTVPLPAVAWAMVATALVTAGGNALNDLTDEPIDQHAHPGRPLPAGRVSRGALHGLVALSFTGALVAGALAGLAVLGLVAAAELVLGAYEASLKADGLAGNLVVAGLVAATFLAGALAAGTVTPSVAFLAGAALFANVAREVWKDAEDAEHDIGRLSVAQRWGPGVAHRTAQLATVVAVVLSPLPLVFGFGGVAFAVAIAIADVVFLSSILSRVPATCQRLSKAGMVAALIAFTLGAIA